MLVPKKNRHAVYQYLFKEGVLTAKKELDGKHTHIDVPNLHVVKLLQSLRSRGFVKEKFSWQYLYYTLTDEGIEYLREYLHVSADTVPATLKKASKPQPPPSFGRGRVEGAEGPIDSGRGRGRGRGGRGGRGRGGRGGLSDDGYRGPKTFDEAPAEFNPEFDSARGGFRGRGRGGSEFRGRGRGRGGFEGESTRGGSEFRGRGRGRGRGGFEGEIRGGSEFRGRGRGRGGFGDESIRGGSERGRGRGRGAAVAAE
jgi:small subunit ribosomal protein S10e